MYLSATMTIDPSHLTQLRRKPTKGFRRFAELMTGNLLSKREEHETFTALSIMQEINISLRSVGVTDVVKFTKDGEVLYEDASSSNTDDLPTAIDTLAGRRTPRGESFSSLSLLLEHHLPTIALIIEIKISRVHEIGVYPIQISINGLDAELQTSDSSKTLNDRLEEVFNSQQTYDNYTESKKAEFEAFISQLEQAFRSRMRIDNLHQRVYTNVVRPGLTPSRTPSRTSSVDPAYDTTAGRAPMLQRYDGGSDSLMYLWMWSSFMHSNNIYCHDTTIVSESGMPAFNVGSEGFNAGESSTLDPDAPFETPDCPIEAVDGVNGEVNENTNFGILDTGDTTHSSWFDSFAFGGDTGDAGGHDAGGGDGGASCGSSCGSSCGGGCGGGCGS